jgi:hypothetical protein
MVSKEEAREEVDEHYSELFKLTTVLSFGLACFVTFYLCPKESLLKIPAGKIASNDIENRIHQIDNARAHFRKDGIPGWCDDTTLYQEIEYTKRAIAQTSINNLAPFSLEEFGLKQMPNENLGDFYIRARKEAYVMQTNHLHSYLNDLQNLNNTYNSEVARCQTAIKNIETRDPEVIAYDQQQAIIGNQYLKILKGIGISYASIMAFLGISKQRKIANLD